MSTIASPRDPTRRITPTSSTRGSLDLVRSALTSPVNPSHPNLPPGPPPKRSNRAALREYYNLRATAPRIELPDSEVPPGDVDAPDFDADQYVAKVVAESSLEDLLRLYTTIVGEVRALDAEKKALVYDNYNKLITATETIKKMRANMDPLNPMASTLDPAIAQIYSQASSIRETLRESVPAPDSTEGKKREAELKAQRAWRLAAEVLATPERLRKLVREGKVQEARKQWEMPRRLLESWRERGVGGEDVQECLDEGDAVFVSTSTSTSTGTGTGTTSARVLRDGKK